MVLQANALGTASLGVQYFDGTSVYSGLTENNGVLISNNSGTPSFLAAGTTGQVLVATTGSSPSWATLSAIGVTSITGTANQVLANGLSGSAQTGAVTLTLPQNIGTGNSPTFVGLNLSGLTASQAVVTDGSKNLASLAYSFVVTGSSLIQRDSNGNAASNNFVSNVTTVVSAGGTTSMSAGSTRIQKITGSTTQTFTLPNATILISGWTFEFNNNSTGSVTVNNNSSSLVATVLAGAYAYVILTDNSTAAGVWDVHWFMPSSAAYGTAGLTVTGTIRGTTSVSSPQLLLTGSGSGTISILPQAAAGTYNFNLPTTAGSSGDLLTSGGGSGTAMTWTTPSTGLVTSITGTTNQIIASASTGAVTLSAPQNLNTAANFQVGTLGINTSAAANTGLTISAASSQQFLIKTSGTLAFSGAPIVGYSSGVHFTPSSSQNAFGFSFSDVFTIAGSTTSTTVVELGIGPQFNGAGTATNAYGYYSVPFTVSGGGAITNAYMGYFVNPGTGTTATALYSDDETIGYAATSPPTNGLIVKGNAGFGTSSPASTSQVSITPAISATLTSALIVNPTYTSTSGTLYGEQITPAFNPPTGDTYTAIYGASIAPTITPTGTGTVTTAYGLSISGPSVGSNTVTTGYGLYVTGPSGAGTITTAYSGYFNTPATGTTKIPLYADGMSIGSGNATNAPGAGNLLVSGSVGVGTTTSPIFSVDIEGSTNGTFAALGVRNTNSGSSALTIVDFGNDTSASRAFIFVNSSTRTADGGANNVTFRTDSGNLYLSAGGGQLLQLNGTTHNASINLTAATAPVSTFDVNGSISVGTYAGVSAAPPGGMLISGNVGIGSTTINGMFNVGSAAQFYVTSGGTINTSGNYQQAASVAGAVSAYINNTSNSSSAYSIFQLINDASNSLSLFINSSGRSTDGGTNNATIRTSANMILGASNTDQMYFNGTSIGIYQSSPNAASALEITSTTQGLRFPNMTTTQKNAMANVAGMVVFDTSLGKLCVNNGSAWQTITSV